MKRLRYAKIVATLGPASSGAERIAELAAAGVDLFRLNFSHGSHAEHRARIMAIREVEKRAGRPLGVLLDLQGPKLRIGAVQGTDVRLEAGARFHLDTNPAPGDARRVQLPHPEVYAALQPGMELLLDDGRLRLQVLASCADVLVTEVRIGGALSAHKGVNVPDVVLPLSSLTAKDRADLAFGLDLGVDWLAASFVQRASDIDELRARVGTRAAIMATLEKPAAIDHLEAIIERADGIMVARGDLGVELPPERVPSIQKRVVRESREAGKPVVVATQMLESMIDAPLPTRAEASDVATAVYDGADAVMLSGETAVGAYPVAAVRMMDRIITAVEQDPHYRKMLDTHHPDHRKNAADAICDGLSRAADILSVAAIVTYTRSGFSSLRAARERPKAPILSLTPNVATARRLALAWGVHAVIGEDVTGVQEMVDRACETARAQGYAQPGAQVAIMAGMPFGVPGTTNLLRIAAVA